MGRAVIAVLGVALMVTLAACQTAKPLTLGKEVAAPYGYIEMCKREPESVFCKQ